MENEDTGASFQVGYGETRASNLWEYSWMKEWLDTYNTNPERAEKALEELEKAFDMPYMGKDRCDDATRYKIKGMKTQFYMTQADMMSMLSLPFQT